MYLHDDFLLNYSFEMIVSVEIEILKMLFEMHPSFRAPLYK